MSLTGSTDPEPLTAAPPLPYADTSTPRPEQIGASSGITRGDVASLALKLLGIYFLVQSASAFIFLIEITISSLRSWQAGRTVYYVAATAMQLAVGLILLLRGDRIALRLLPKSPHQIPSSPGSPVELQAAAFAVVGVFFALTSLPELASTIVQLANDAAQSIQPEHSAQFVIRQVMKPAAQLFLGVWLFLGSKRLTAYWQRTHSGSKPPPIDEERPL